MNTINASQLIAAIEDLAPLHYQETYDNAGLSVGNPQAEITAALLCVDVTEAILDEAIRIGANFILSHHPVIFKGLKRLSGKTATERIVEKAIKNNLLLYAAHTNIDSVRGGVSEMMAERLQLRQRKVLSPRKNEWLKLITFVPHEYADQVRNALFEAGAGHFKNYSQCSWNSQGEGTFFPHDGAQPFVGEKGSLHTEPETRVETVIPRAYLSKALQQLHSAHPYEEPAFDIIPLENNFTEAGFGLVGELPQPMEVADFLQQTKAVFGTPHIRHSQAIAKKITRVAVCGGSGASLLHEAVAAGATAFVSADFKYHDFFDADTRLVIVDVGHYESERDVLTIFYNCLTKKIPNFAVHLTKNTTNAIHYF